MSVILLGSLFTETLTGLGIIATEETHDVTPGACVPPIIPIMRSVSPGTNNHSRKKEEDRS